MKINNYRNLLLASMLLSISGTIAAETFSYTFASDLYKAFREDIDGISEDLEGDTINLGLSLNFAQNAAITASYDMGSTNVTFGGVTVGGDIDAASFGAMYRIPI